MHIVSKYLVVCVISGTFVLGGFAQIKRTPRPQVEATPVPKPTPEASKKNERPKDNAKQEARSLKDYTPTYFYEFSRPGFVTSRVLIEHDSTGKGTISFLKQGFNELMTDPLQLSPVTIKGINETLERMDFLGSTENYQFEKDFSNLGNIVFRYVNGARERTVKYNWTINKDAKFLMDEYRRISNEAVWKFDLVVARENQPLQTPELMDSFDSYFSRNELTDPPHLIPLLKELSNDERLPLIARNHATRLIKQIEKIKK